MVATAMSNLTAKQKWKRFYRAIRIARREADKAILDMMIYGTGIVLMPKDGSDPCCIPLADIKLAEFHENLLKNNRRVHMQEFREQDGSTHQEFYAALKGEEHKISKMMEIDVDHFVSERGETLVRRNKKVGRNEPCPCGSGIKFKKCCISKAKAS
jgi:hypothetical protein